METNDFYNNNDIVNYYDSETPKDFPIAYKAGFWFFCEMPFDVNKRVLIPRKETEYMVSAVLGIACVNIRSTGSVSILDLCTGSGCIACAIKKSLPHANVVAADNSKEALEVAKANAKRHNLDIKFIKSDMLEKIDEKFQIVVCNPPYIKTHEIGIYDKSILHEPKMALDGGMDGLYFYRQIFAQVDKCFDNYGYLVLEVGDNKQAVEVVELALNSEKFSNVQTIKDPSGVDRIVVCVKM